MTVQNAPVDFDLEAVAILARKRTKQDRAQLAETLNDGLGARIAQASEREQAMFDAVLEELVSSVEQDIRVRLAERLAERPDAPRPLIALLANREIEIAGPVLRSSRALTDDDLIEVIRFRTLEHQLAVTARSEVSEAVSEELVGTGQTRVIVALLNNHGAKVRAATLEYLAEQAERVNAFREPLARRHDLPDHVAKRLYRLVSGVLRNELAERFDLDMSVIDEAIEHVIRLATKALAANSRHPTMAQSLADEIAQTERFDPGLMVEALKRGEIALFEAMLVQQSALRSGDVRRIIYDAGGEALAVACRAIGMTQASFADVFELTRRASRENVTVAKEMRGRVLTLFARLKKDAAAAMVRQWRRHPALIREQFALSDCEHHEVA